MFYSLCRWRTCGHHPWKQSLLGHEEHNRLLVQTCPSADPGEKLSKSSHPPGAGGEDPGQTREPEVSGSSFYGGRNQSLTVTKGFPMLIFPARWRHATYSALTSGPSEHVKQQCCRPPHPACTAFLPGLSSQHTGWWSVGRYLLDLSLGVLVLKTESGL